MQTTRYYETLCSVTIVIVQHSTQTFVALNRSCVSEMNWVRLNQPVAKP